MNWEPVSGPPRLLPPPPPGLIPVDGAGSDSVAVDGVADAPGPRGGRPRGRSWLLAVGLVGLIAGGVGGFVGSRLGPSSTAGPNSPVVMPSSEPLVVAPSEREPLPETGPTMGEMEIVEVIESVGPSVVSITTDVETGGMFGSAAGSGVIITSDGEILTNAHVIEGARSIRVRLAGETEPIPATLVASDPSNDLALLRIEATGLPAAVFAAADSPRIGQEVLAIGFALNLDGEATFTRGIISALDRTISTAFGVLNRMIQTDAAISSGNSGGPLVNTSGQIVGINTAVARGGGPSQASNIGFAISVGEVLRVVDELRQMGGGTRVEGFLGVGLADRSDGGSGAVISGVEPGTPAARAGVEPGDVVVMVDDSVIDGSLALIAAIRDRGPGDTVSIIVLRDGERVEVEANLEARPDS
jgi:S1-C subfamily serine protease